MIQIRDRHGLLSSAQLNTRLYTMVNNVLDIIVDMIIKEEAMTDDGRMLSIIREYRAGINDPDKRWPEIEFDRASYTKWALDEICNMIIENPDKSVLENVNTFKNMMHKYAYETSCYNERIKFIFELAWEVAADVEDRITGIL